MAKTVKLKYDTPRWGGYNQPDNNERKAELPIGAWFLEKFNHDVIEFGEVMNSHIECSHTIYDLGNEKPGTIVQDARDVDYTGKNVLSISTVEHIGDGALKLIKRIQKEAANYIITFPPAFNKEFDKEIMDSKIKYFIIERSLDGINTWKQVTNKDLTKYEYNKPYYAGHAIVVITNLDVKFTYEY